jgi:hypothetical protein
VGCVDEGGRAWTVSTVHRPELLIMDDLSSMLATRDGVCAAWRAGAMDPTLAQERLRALGTRDASGAWWRLRPGPHGAVLVQISPDGGVRVADSREYQAPVAVSWWRRAAVAGAGVLWVLVLLRHLSGAG